MPESRRPSLDPIGSPREGVQVAIRGHDENMTTPRSGRAATAWHRHLFRPSSAALTTKTPGFLVGNGGMRALYIPFKGPYIAYLIPPFPAKSQPEDTVQSIRHAVMVELQWYSDRPGTVNFGVLGSRLRAWGSGVSRFEGFRA